MERKWVYVCVGLLLLTEKSESRINGQCVSETEQSHLSCWNDRKEDVRLLWD